MKTEVAMNERHCPQTNRVTATLSLLLATSAAGPAAAQQWSATDRRPRPYNVVAVDSTMTMAIDVSTGNWNPAGNNRLYNAKQLLTGFGTGNDQNGAMFLFRHEFLWGTYSYSGSIEAHIKDGSGSLPRLGSIPNTVVAPIWGNRALSYSTTRAMIDGLSADYCLTTGKGAYNCLEQRLPGGATGPACITSGCAQDAPLVEHITQNPLSGLQLPVLTNPPGYSATSTIYPAGWQRYTFPCDRFDPTGYPDNPTVPGALPPGCPRTSTNTPYNAACPSVNIPYELAHELGGTYYSWPRYSDIDNDGDVDISPSDIAQDICQPLSTAYNKIQQKLNACLDNPPTLSPPFTCNPSTLSNTLCAPASPFMGGPITPINSPPMTIPTTCVCNASGPGCVAGGGNDACGNPLYFPARQQVGICRSHDASRQPASTLDSVPGNDNILRDPGIRTPGANPELWCRTNVVTFVTDAEGAHPLGVMTTSPRNEQFYFADLGVEQNTVVGVGDMSRATALQSIIRGSAPPAVAAVPGLPVTSGVSALRARFARDLNRSLKGVYAAATPSLSTYQDRAAFMVMEIPGNSSPSHVDYFGRPLRLEWWRIDPLSGAPLNRLFSTDEASRANIGTVVPNGDGNVIPGVEGTPTVWRSGMSRFQTLGANTLDRDGNNVVDAHPAVRWGNANGGEGSRPVIVGAPLDAPDGRDRGAAQAWRYAVRNRDRVAYALSNGVVHAYRVGRVSGSIVDNTGALVNAGVTTLGSLGTQNVGITYDDNPASPGMGAEIFRYRPRFITAAGNDSAALVGGQPRWRYNDILPQSLIDRGQIFVRDVQLDFAPSPPRFGTIMVVSQGQGGRGFAALDVSDPNAPQVLWDGVLLMPGARALAAPSIYQWPNPSGGDPIPAMVVVGGALTPPPAGGPYFDFLEVYNLKTGALISRATLPRSTPTQMRAWPNTPVCVDREGAGQMDRCFVLATDGTLALVRVNATNGTFFPAANITPGGISGTFQSGMAAYFTANNQVALVFGSGDLSRIERGGGPANRVFKVISEGTGTATPVARFSNVCRPGAALVDGSFTLGPGEMVISPPTVAKGTVAFSTYRPGATGCQDGQSYVYAFDFETCRDVIAPPGTMTKPTAATAVGAGMPSSPVLLRRTGQLLVHTTASPSGGATTPVAVRTRGGVFEAVRPTFFRIRASSR
jgi:hypothetical protein